VTKSFKPFDEDIEAVDSRLGDADEEAGTATGGGPKAFLTGVPNGLREACFLSEVGWSIFASGPVPLDAFEEDGDRLSRNGSLAIRKLWLKVLFVLKYSII
jgi:hypothetical protein